MKNTDIIEIKIPNDVENDIKKVSNISETLKLQIQHNIREKTKVTETDPVLYQTDHKPKPNDFEPNFLMLLEILKDRGNNNITTCLSEINEIVELDNGKQLCTFMGCFHRFLRQKSYQLKKLKRSGKTCYLLHAI